MVTQEERQLCGEEGEHGVHGTERVLGDQHEERPLGGLHPRLCQVQTVHEAETHHHRYGLQNNKITLTINTSFVK